MADNANIVFDADPNEQFEPTPEFEIGAQKEEAPVEETANEKTNEDESQEVQPSSEEEQGQDVQGQETNETVEEASEAPVEEAQDTQSESGDSIEEVIEEIIDTEASLEETQPQQPSINLPEGIDKLVQFMNETGGTLEDYIGLNRDVDSYSEEQLLLEYYKDSKPHWSDQEILEHLEDEFSIGEYDEGDEISRDDRRKIRLKKEELFKAKQFLQGQKEKYYENLKLSSQQSAAQQSAQAKAQEEAQAKVRAEFEQGTQKFFSEGFEGFVFDGGDGKKFRIREQGEKVMESQIDLSNVLGEHLNEDGSIKDLNSYHQALYAFKNYNKISQHFYQQGKADALKERAQVSKNIDMSPKTDNKASTVSSKPKISFVNPPGWE